MHIKIIELKTELESKHDLLEALVREKQKVEHGERDREVMCADCHSVDKHDASDTEDNDEEKCCLGRAFYKPLDTILEKNTVDEKYIAEALLDEEFQDTMARIKIIELKAELEVALLETLIREKQKVDHERDREVMRKDCNGSVDKHEASDTDDDDKFIRCAKRELKIFARHSVITNTSQSVHDEPEGGKTKTKVGFFKSLAQSIRTKRDCVSPDRVSSRANGGHFDSPAKSLCKESTPASEGRMQQAVEQTALINASQQHAGMHLLRVCSSQDTDEGNALMERFMRLQRLSSLLDSPDTLDRLMSRSSSVSRSSSA